MADKPKDKYSAVWVSHSSMGDFLKCPRAYYLHNIYKNPKTGRKINIINPALALGQIVHEVVEGLGDFKAEERFKRPLLEVFDKAWEKVSGKRGGFRDADEEAQAKERGRTMIERVVAHPGPLASKTVKIKLGANSMPPNFYLSEDDNIILCGKIDWLEYVPEKDAVRLIDFKTGRNEENEDSLQLPIYHLLLKHCQERPLAGAAYWYLDRDDAPTPVELPDLETGRTAVLAVAKKIKDARERKEFLCPRGAQGCFACRPFEKVIRGEAEFIGTGEYNQDVYVVAS
ncbi:MAG: PD-(D/E)XK nuclease family protein [bacterium]|nr:PD-(D/E)XK nuclease family protein [bacterium]